MFDARGFGFIRSSNPKVEDIYFHASELPGEPGKRSVKVGAHVEYTEGVYNGRPAARDIRILQGGAE